MEYESNYETKIMQKVLSLFKEQYNKEMELDKTVNGYAYDTHTWDDDVQKSFAFFTLRLNQYFNNAEDLINRMVSAENYIDSLNLSQDAQAIDSIK